MLLIGGVTDDREKASPSPEPNPSPSPSPNPNTKPKPKSNPDPNLNPNPSPNQGLVERVPAILPPAPVTPPAKKKVGRKAIASQPIEELTPGAAKRQKARESMQVVL